jgi:protein-L-isoaspartate O-methyltransferase
MKFAILFSIIILIKIVISKKIKEDNKKCVNPTMDLIVKHLKSKKEIKSKAVEDIVCSIDRGDFLRNKTEPFALEAVYIGYGATLSGPNVHVFAMEKALEKFSKEEKIKILDIGSGSGIL